MPEGPEVRRYADLVHNHIAGQKIASFLGRTKSAKAWHEQNPEETLLGRSIECVRAHGKNLVAYLTGDVFFYSHLMMWGRWHIHDAPPDEIDRRERARIVTESGATAILMSAPIFEIHRGDPKAVVDSLRTLGPDILSYPDEPGFDTREFTRRLFDPANIHREIGAILLDQTVVAGIGNYLRAEMLFLCRLDPFRTVSELSEADIERLCQVIPAVAEFAYRHDGRTAPDAERDRMAQDTALIYGGTKAAEWATRHYAFRRTNLPCLVCGDVIRQKRQVTRVAQEEQEKDKERIIYFCPVCQNTTVALPPVRRKRTPPREGIPE